MRVRVRVRVRLALTLTMSTRQARTATVRWCESWMPSATASRRVMTVT